MRLIRRSLAVCLALASAHGCSRPQSPTPISKPVRLRLQPDGTVPHTHTSKVKFTFTSDGVKHFFLSWDRTSSNRAKKLAIWNPTTWKLIRTTDLPSGDFRIGPDGHVYVQAIEIDDHKQTVLMPHFYAFIPLAAR